MIRKEYSAPEIQVIELNINVSLLTMSMPNTLVLDVNDPTDDIINANDALAPLLDDMVLFGE